MRPTHKNRNRNRHRSGGGGGGGGGGGNPLSRVYESNGPDVKVRGTAQTIADKYLQLGRDAQSSGDIVMAESYFQHAEHYLRIVFAAQAYNQQQQQQFRRPDDEFDEDDQEDQAEAAVEQRGGAQPVAEPDGLGDQPMIEGAPERTAQQGQQFRPPREQREFGREGREQGQGRDRFRPRWQDRRQDNQQPQGQQGQPPRNEDQPRPEPQQLAPAADPGRWEAPSFLRRPAAAPAASEPPPAEEVTAQPAPKRRVERRPRKEVAETPSPADGE
ncbi:MAG: DUF4167 domain-containing protein [Aestuariivirga sp.]|uniref:DUF4167 domain-containing protein n=1 Tax=Aestuariivirga sp. TaxID=2650926 RepID=UPI0038D1BBEA